MNNPNSPVLSIRKMTAGDLDCVLAWRNHPEIRRYMYTQHEITLPEHRGWFERFSSDPRKHLLIFEVNEIAQGFVNINELSFAGVADWGFYIAPDAVKGTGRQLGLTALNYAFNTLQLRKICGQALASNERSIKFHHALGFRQEGTLREQYCDGENYHSIICFGLLKVEWQATIRELSK
ncbi:UDP-4-amino-4,6-dideoxy-N-acetyl-beta-L-altrosamine N-acetyltransferase [Pseudomonas tussilaginis]|uniref:UDP-4-amino-4, 6-dideoxy-N-acetyl-beta-L-altrosamine N-acetyltransferase n=1 Tax=Pseudomonas putida TaxID=303 RepID=UPI00236457C8|nr:UDP-4-amino-4,6-dideoxy-N-acetyl-beta-L-altrosamine N-acetyltransferase [Pseudomonas putida]MDD1976826.1 UDP-4-amino-4,6-dideoxy-N-acetyl-beta-L-altrosamine N-acetyltransferase [Pseudomonas putida]